MGIGNWELGIGFTSQVQELLYFICYYDWLASGSILPKIQIAFPDLV
ncbi:MAG: hypothetical protein F6K47_00935 [Symploca sp. SIO2E6]|nr:hypothetical protein [Symploca sp. SIO2E6]